MSPRRAKTPDNSKRSQDPEVTGILLLLTSVLQRALRDFLQYKNLSNDKQRYQYALDAWEWFMDDDTSEITSFVSVCNILNLDVKETRQRIVRLTRRSNDRSTKSREAPAEEDTEGEAQS